jgi:hypothetical protein
VIDTQQGLGGLHRLHFTVCSMQFCNLPAPRIDRRLSTDHTPPETPLHLHFVGRPYRPHSAVSHARWALV